MSIQEQRPAESVPSEVLRGQESLQQRSLRVLEWPVLQQRILGGCQWVGGREELQGWHPLTHLEDLQERQARVREALAIEAEGLGRLLGGLDDPRPWLASAAKGRTLDPEQLLVILGLCRISREVAQAFRGCEKQWPLTADLLRGVLSFSRLETALARSILPDGKVSDEASPALRRLRAEVREAEEKLTRSLQSLLRHPDLSKTYQEPIITQRQGRFVIPVKADYKGRFPGLVIDSSSSGATVFMEPYIAVSLGNDLRSKQQSEAREVHRILVDLSQRVANDSGALQRAAAKLARFDALLAVARFAFRKNAFLPNVSEGGELRLLKAHHPLIDEGSVPIDLEMASDVRTLVITGPNTGGKTVALKTVGLSIYMAGCGLPICASEESSVPLLPKVLADIGDEQSLSQSLSTFSAHLVHILEILKEADGSSLVLLDELGAGTDPSEGGALGTALLNELQRLGSRTLASTHLSALKGHAKATPGFENAAVEFDTRTLRPTYRVLMGIPGRSNALAIASGLGLSDRLLREAREYLAAGDREMEELLDDLEIERAAAQRSDLALQEEREQLELQRREYESRLAELEQRKEVELETARLEGKEALDQARRESRKLLREFQEGLKEAAEERREALLEARRLAREWAERVRGHDSAEQGLERYSQTSVSEDEIGFDDLGQKARTLARTVETGLESEHKRLPKPIPKPGARGRGARGEQQRSASGPLRTRGPGTLEPGTRVYAPKLGQQGEVIEQKGNRVDVRLGILKMSLQRKEVEVLSDQTRPQAPKVQDVIEVRPSSSAAHFERRLSVRGQTVDVALLEVDRFLDRAYLSQIESVEILHGKGTGALRNAIQDHLKHHRQVADYRDGGHHEGGWGLTVVKLRL